MVRALKNDRYLSTCETIRLADGCPSRAERRLFGVKSRSACRQPHRRFRLAT
jgi:hypothetical protein